MASCIILQFVLLSSIMNIAVTLPTSSEYATAKERYSAKEVLEYGDSCSIDDHRIVVKNNIKFHEILAQKRLHLSSFVAFTKDLHDIISSTGSLCDSDEKHLECNEITSTCDCGDDRKYGINTVSVRDGNKCMATRGSTCAPDDIMPGQVPVCINGTQCQIKRTGILCTLNNYYAELERLGLSNIDDPLGLFSTIYQGLVTATCQCI